MDKWIILLVVILVVAVVVGVLFRLQQGPRKRPRVTRASRPYQQAKVGVTVAERKDTVDRGHQHQANRQPQGTVASDQNLPIANNLANDKQLQTNKELADIFGDEDDEPQQDNSLALDKKHKRLLDKLCTRPQWSKDELIELAHQHCLMPDGAIEAINHWAIELCQDLLVIDNNDCWEIDRDIANCLNSGGKDGNN